MIWDNMYLSRLEIITLLYLRKRTHIISSESEPSPYFSFSSATSPVLTQKVSGNYFCGFVAPPPPACPPSLLHFNLCFSIAGCSTSEIQRRSFCVCVCPVGIHVARQINNYRLTEYTTLQEGGKKTISGPFDVKHERDQNYTGGKEEGSFGVHFLSLCWHCFLLLLCLALWVCVIKRKKKTVTKAGQFPH